MLETKVANAKVFIRIFPLEKTCWKFVKVLNDRRRIYVRRLQDFSKGYENNEPLYWKFSTDGIFYNSMQSDIYSKVITQDILNDIFEGHNLVLFAYGPTGTGKSLTSAGLLNSYEDRGIAPRFIESIFDMVATFANKYKYEIKMSYVETTKMYLVDLLDEENERLTMSTIKNIKQIKVHSKESALKILFQAEGKREFSKDCKDHYSHSRNSVLSFHLYIKSLESSDLKIRTSQVHIVDLGGVDTVGNIECFCKNFSDIGNANLAKSQLEQFLMVLIINLPETVLVKQRLNILVLYLKDVLKNTSYLRFIGHVRIKKQNLKLTISMLRFAQIVRNLKCTLGPPGKMIGGDIDYKIMHQEILKLEQEKHLYNIFNNEGPTNLTEGRIMCLKSMVDEYLKNNLGEMELIHFTDVHTIMKYVKEMYNNLEMEKAEKIKEAYNQAVDDCAKTMMNVNKSECSVVNAYRTSSKKTSLSWKSKKTGQSEMSMTSGLKKADSKSTASRITEKKSVLRTSGIGSTAKRSSVLTEENEEMINGAVLETMPEYDEAYKAFMSDENFKYEYYNGLIMEEEHELRAAHKNYIEEIQALRNLQHTYNMRTEQIVILQMQRDLQLSSSHSIEVNAGEVKDEIIKQKENILTCQADIKLRLDHYNSLKQCLVNEFDKYCCIKYKTVLNKSEDDIDNMVMKEMLQSIINYNESNIKTIPAENYLASYFLKLQKMLKKHIAANIARKEELRKPFFNL